MAPSWVVLPGTTQDGAAAAPMTAHVEPEQPDRP
jgi:hypothetical protein